jgi:hypothetical protein
MRLTGQVTAVGKTGHRLPASQSRSFQSSPKRTVQCIRAARTPTSRKRKHLRRKPRACIPSVANCEIGHLCIGVGMRPDPSIDHVDNSANLVLREAKRLQRAATNSSLSAALPVLRRLLAANAVPRIALPELFRRRDLLKRKHMLRTLAVEAGFQSWEEYRPTLDATPSSALKHLEVIQPGAGHLNLWFPGQSEAEAFASRHGGHAMRVGGQAVVLQACGASAGYSHG